MNIITTLHDLTSQLASVKIVWAYGSVDCF